ncbi:RTA-like protein [Niveomyces insectorum RCEF 264]|uniref:RTA-like protein n=1 Tax=Niveomyces insectorum RCEF 264 TaxID=1081102 RepID=A0A167ZWF5_9HYPO|nr:RTA-like protein [Niveomyces insectorum RCEF 264]
MDPYYKYYHYDPSLAASCLFAVLFGLSTTWHSVVLVRRRTWYLIPVVVGGLFEIVGYAARAVSHAQAPALTLGPYVVQTLLLLVAPPLFAASLYMLLGRIIVAVDGGDAYSLIKRRWLTKVFVASDVVCFLVQLGGAGLMASSQSATSTTGSRIVLAGLLVQIVVFALFVVVAGVFHRRCLRAEMALRAQDTAQPPPWRRFLGVLYVASGLVLARNIVRVAEFVEGFNGYIVLHEVFLYVFDAVPMLAAMGVLNVWHPARLANDGNVNKADGGLCISDVEMRNMDGQE